MKQATKRIIGKDINQFAAQHNDLPSYFGDRYNKPEDDWDKPLRKVNGEMIAKKYNAILSIIDETKATVYNFGNTIFISYNNGEIKIERDLFTDTFLLPRLQIVNTVNPSHPINH